MAWVDVKTAAGGQQIWVTEKPEMLRIMRHEFRDGTDFDPKPLCQYLATLTREQVRLLMSYPKEKYLGKQRLVIFITLDPNISLPMCADQCDSVATLINSNSHFAVFHCDGATQMVSLVSYTKEFNLFNHRLTLERRDAAAPKVYKISAMNMSHVASGEGDTIWNRVSTVGRNDIGTAIYGGDAQHAPNSLHGMINTAGCWMLFRNYNWYSVRQAEFLQLYRDYRRNPKIDKTGELAARLTGLGYGDVGRDPLRFRFLGWERNYAYTWFTRDVIGVDYFSKNPFVNEDNIYDSVQVAAYPPVPTEEQMETRPYNSHSWGSRHKKESSFVMDSTLWTKNAFGFKTAEDFAPFLGATTLHLESHSWADLYVFGS